MKRKRTPWDAKRKAEADAKRAAKRAARAADSFLEREPPPTPELEEASRPPAPPSMTLGEALSRMRGPDAATPEGEAPPAPDAAEPEAKPPDTGWTKYAGYLGSGLVVKVNASVIRRGGKIPNEPDDDVVDYLRKSIETGLKETFGDSAVPWWAAIGMAWGGVYASQSIGAKRLPAPPKEPAPHGLGVNAAPSPRVMEPPPAPPAPPQPPPAPVDVTVTVAPSVPAGRFVRLERVGAR